MTHWSHSNQLALGTQVITILRDAVPPWLSPTSASSQRVRTGKTSLGSRPQRFVRQSSPRNGTGILGSVSKVVYHSHVSGKKHGIDWGIRTLWQLKKGVLATPSRFRSLLIFSSTVFTTIVDVCTCLWQSTARKNTDMWNHWVIYAFFLISAMLRFVLVKTQWLDWKGNRQEYLGSSCRFPIWVNYNISLTWIKAIWGSFPLLTMISSEGEQWGRDEIYPDQWRI